MSSAHAIRKRDKYLAEQKAKAQADALALLAKDENEVKKGRVIENVQETDEFRKCGSSWMIVSTMNARERNTVGGVYEKKRARFKVHDVVRTQQEAELRMKEIANLKSKNNEDLTETRYVQMGVWLDMPYPEEIDKRISVTYSKSNEIADTLNAYREQQKRSQKDVSDRAKRAEKEGLDKAVKHGIDVSKFSGQVPGDSTSKYLDLMTIEAGKLLRSDDQIIHTGARKVMDSIGRVRISTQNELKQEAIEILQREITTLDGIIQEKQVFLFEMKALREAFTSGCEKPAEPTIVEKK